MTQTEREFLKQIQCDIGNYLKNTVKDPEEKLVMNKLEILQKLNGATRMPSCSDFLNGYTKALREVLFIED
jgi:hypothetical protein